MGKMKGADTKKEVGFGWQGKAKRKKAWTPWEIRKAARDCIKEDPEEELDRLRRRGEV